MLCLAVVCSSGLFSSGVVGVDGRERRAARRVVEAAQKEVGVRESTENAGVRVDEYNAYVGFRKVAWCASFVSWCHGQAGYSAPNTAWSPALFPESRLQKEALPGMVMGIYFPKLKRIAHCGIVESVTGNYVHTIEGNTNVAGAREGIGVFRRIRHRKLVSRYADWVSKLPPVPP